jgi:hypothetical protein
MSDIISREFGEVTQTSAVTPTGAPAATPEPATPAPKEPAAPVAFASDPSVGLYNDKDAPTPPTVGWAKGTELPLIYHAAAQARAAGYSWDEINDKFTAARQAANEAGYSDAEVNTAFGLSPAANKEPTPAGMEGLNLQPDTADNIRAFANKYLTPATNEDFQMPQTAGDFAKMVWGDIVDVGKIFGGGVANGMAAIVEGLDGKPRSMEDQVRLGIEAQSALALFAGGLRGGVKEASGTPEPAGVDALRQAVPTLQETLDAATAVARAHPDGLTQGTLLHAAQSLGQNFVDTGEHPLDAAQRAVNDPAVMTTIHAHMDANVAHVAEIKAAPSEALLEGGEPLDAKGVAEEGAAAVQEPGLIPLNPIPANEALLNSGNADTLSSLGAGAFGKLRMPEMAINPETIGQVNPELSGGLLQSFRQTFAIQGLDRAGAGMLRNAFAQTQATLLRSAENLRRFGRAVGDLSSVARREWWHAYEGSDLSAYPEGSVLDSMGKEIRSEFDRRYARMQDLGIAPNYIEGYLPRMYQDPAGALRVFGKRPLGGTGTHMRQRVFQYLQDAEAAGMKLVTDNPVEASLMRLHDMDRFIMKHEIALEMNTNGMGAFYKAGQRVPEGLTQVPGITLPGEKGTFYAHTPTAIMINRYLSPGVGGTVFAPIYDVLRSSTSMYTTIKLTMSMYHPVVLTANSIFSAAATGLVQMSRGGFGNVTAGLGKIAKSAVAPVEDFLLGRKLINYAKTGVGDDFKLTNMYNALVAGGTRFGASEVAHSSAAGSFWRNIHGSVAPESGLTTLPQEVAAMFRNAPPITIGGTQLAPGYVRAMGQMVPRVLDTMSGPIMDGFVPAMKAGASARMLQEALDAHPDMGLADIRRVAGRISDITDNRIGETVQDNLFWNKWLHDVNNVLFMAPQWFMGKLRLVSGAAADGLKGGYVEGALSHNIAYMITVPAGLMMMGALYGAAKGTWNADWTLHDYFHPPTGGTDAQGNPERIDIPTPARDAYGWTHHPEQELLNKVNGAYGMVQDLATNRQYGGKVAITDPNAPLTENVRDYAHELAKQLAPIITQKPQSSETNISLVEQLLGIRESTFEIQNPERAMSYQDKDIKRAVKAKNKQDAQ